MAEKEESQLDWTHLPHGVEEISLWESLHDGELVSCTSNSPEQWVNLEFSVEHLLTEAEKGVRFSIRLTGVTSVRAIAHLYVVERTWREESMSWSDLEKAIITDPFEVYDASFVADAKTSALRLGGILDGERYNDLYVEIVIRGKEMAVSRSDRNDLSVAEFLDIGRNYWQRDLLERSL